MNPIEVCYASSGGPDMMLVDTIEVWEEGSSFRHLYASGYSDRVCTTEDGRTLTFTALAMELGWPKNDNSGFQSIIIGLDNTTGEPQLAVEAARRSGNKVWGTLRRYLAGDLSFPQERFRMQLLSRDYEPDSQVAKLTFGFFDLLNTTGNRRILTAEDAPGLRYT
ncbi:DUF1833 family protein [Pseudomonas cremoricolorata]|uniref:DUF1833 domain-containing protein n=1 Tax=Pseudomonas cremoricolorata TaxID=157783 RepID=A0A089WVB6_9PSED|nr:DUF1833 family protein [Pseudomonas cremoricolorata]AIR90532.1 hypothetical protein LK03_15110 [Pseudomonas cremoricolorata]